MAAGCFSQLTRERTLRSYADGLPRRRADGRRLQAGSDLVLPGDNPEHAKIATLIVGRLAVRVPRWVSQGHLRSDPQAAQGVAASRDVPPRRDVLHDGLETVPSSSAGFHGRGQLANGQSRRECLRPTQLLRSACPPVRRAELASVAPRAAWRSRDPDREARALRSDRATGSHPHDICALRCRRVDARPGERG
jgi:hypothetical protein